MTTLNQLFAEQGSVRQLSAQDRLWLDDGTSLFRVHSGEADLYLTWRNERGESGRRHFIGACPIGTIIPSWGTPNEAGWQLLLNGQQNTALQVISEDDLEDDEDQYMELVDHLLNWMMLLYRPLRDRMPPEAISRHRIGETAVLEPGESGIVVSKGGWVAVGQGSMNLYGIAEMAIAPGEYPVPIPGYAWLSTAGDEAASFAVLDLETVLDADPDLESFGLANELLIKGLGWHFQDLEELERSRMMQRVETEKAVMTAGLQTLSGVLKHDNLRPEFKPDEKPWFAACRMVSEATGIRLKDPGVALNDAKDPLGLIERANGLRRRMLTLEGEWWNQDNGAMLAYWENGNPVALIPRKNRRSYDLYDPQTQTVQRVTAKISALLSYRAYMFYRPFGDIKPSPLGVLKFAMSGMGKNFIVFLLAAAMGVILGLVVPVVVGLLVDDIIPSASRDRITEITFLLVALAFASGMFEMTKGLTQLRLEGRMEASSQSAVWDRMLRLPAAFFRQYSAGDLASRANAFTEIRQELSGTTLSTMMSSIFSVFALVLMLVYSPLLTLVVIGLTLVAVLLNVVATFISLAYERKLAENEGVLSGMTLELLSGIAKLRANGAEQRAFARWSNVFALQQQNSYKAGAAVRPVSAIESAFPLLSTIVLFVIVARMDPSDAISVGQFLAFTAAQAMFVGGILGLSDAAANLVNLVPMWERAKPILTHPVEVDPDKGDPGRLQGRIEVTGVEFGYGEDGPQILKGVDLYADPGEFIGIVGTSGSGKSTLLRLLLGFENPQSGSIYFDGQDMSGLDLTALRQQIGVVLQNGYLMQGDIFTNIVGSSPLTPDDAMEAARMAGMEDDIKNMPMGLFTVVSEGGTTLSGGQRQRLLIARALVHHPRVLFFDEATSALDNKTQAQVNRSVEQLEATRFVIAHRLSTIMKADRIYVMDDGVVAESGTYDELMELDGIFADLARRQIA